MTIKYHIPLDLDENCKDIISKLLKKRPEDRISIDGLKNHSFLNIIDFNLLYDKKINPP